MTRSVFHVAIFAIISLTSLAPASVIRTVALSGQQAPGTPVIGVGVDFFAFSPPVLNDAGQTAFLASLVGGISDIGYDGVWSEGSGELERVALKGDQAIGTPGGVNYSGFRRPVLNESGQIAFHAFLSGNDVDSTNDQGLWLQRSATLALVARTGNQAPGTPGGVRFSGPTLSNVAPLSYRFNNAGQVAFWAGLAGGDVNQTNDYGIWSEASGSLALLAREGSQAAGTPRGVNYESLGLPVLNDTGQTAFPASLTGVGIDDVNNYGIWSERSGNLTLVARSGDQAPGAPSGVNLNLGPYTNVVLNNAGQTAFISSLVGAEVDSSNSHGIWSEGSGDLALVARSGSHAPGTPDGSNFETFIYAVLNDAGQTAFRATLTSGGSGIWSEGSGEPALVARGGTQAAGAPSGVVFSLVPNRMGNPILNNKAQSAFHAFLTGAGVDQTNNEGIWATDAGGGLHLIVREGDLLEVGPGDFRTVGTVGDPSYHTLHLETFFPTGNSDGHSSAFNDLGQIAFMAFFTDGSSGVFVSKAAAVPEPSTLALVAVGLLTYLTCLRQSK